MRRYRCDAPIEVDSELQIQGELFKHIVVVCRNPIGSQFELLQNEYAFLSEIIDLDKKTARLKILSKRKIPNLPKPYVHLVLANPKVNVLEAVVEKSVELGVKSITLLATQYSFFRSKEKIKLKVKRLEKIISQALQQSNRHEELILEQPSSLDEFLLKFKTLKKKKGFVFYEKTDASHTPNMDMDMESLEDVYLLVGPEGGFAASEIESAVEFGFECCSLGHQILRVETACVAGVSILKSKMQIW